MKKRKLKKKYVIILLVLVVLAIALITLFAMNKTKQVKEEKRKQELQEVSIYINRYDLETNEELQRIEITDLDEKEKVGEYVGKIKQPGKYETIDTNFTNEILIDYNDITIGIQVGEKEICYYQKESDIKFAYLSEELYDWAIETLNIQE